MTIPKKYADRITLKVSEVAEIMSMKAFTVREWIDDGTLRAMNLSRKPGVNAPEWRIEAAYFWDWLEKRCHSVGSRK